MSSYIVFVLTLIISFVGLVSDVSSATEPKQAETVTTAEFEITFQGLWTRSSNHPSVELPGNAHFTPIIGAVHSDEITLWEKGATASPGFEDVAEIGVNTRFEREIRAKIRRGVLNVIKGNGNIDNTGRDVIKRITADGEHSRLTLATMIAPSHDWFIGVSSLSLKSDNGRWKDAIDVDLFAYDAGTELGSDFSLGPNRTENGRIRLLDGVGYLTEKPFGRLRIRRVR